MFNTTTLNCVCRLQGHEGEVSKVLPLSLLPPPLSTHTPHYNRSHSTLKARVFFQLVQTRQPNYGTPELASVFRYLRHTMSLSITIPPSSPDTSWSHRGGVWLFV